MPLKLGLMGGMISGISFCEFAHDIILFINVDDGESSGAFLVRLDGNNFHRKWRTGLPAAGLGPSVIEDDFAYVISGGFVGKLDLASGRLLWQHSTKAGSTVTFLEYREPVVRNGTVVFSEPETLHNHRTVTMDKRTGKVLVPPHYY
jgi:outer membrane protein assembly factor BamB